MTNASNYYARGHIEPITVLEPITEYTWLERNGVLCIAVLAMAVMGFAAGMTFAVQVFA